LGLASITLLKLDTTGRNSDSSGLSGSDLVVGHWKLSGLFGLRAQDGGSGNSVGSLDVDHLGKGCSQTAKSGSDEENVAHDEGCLMEEVTEKRCLLRCL
jgi:hypothetical protein